MSSCFCLSKACSCASLSVLSLADLEEQNYLKPKPKYKEKQYAYYPHLDISPELYTAPLDQKQPKKPLFSKGAKKKSKHPASPPPQGSESVSCVARMHFYCLHSSHVSCHLYSHFYGEVTRLISGNNANMHSHTPRGHNKALKADIHLMCVRCPFGESRR